LQVAIQKASAIHPKQMSKTLTGSCLIAGSVSIFKLLVYLPGDESSKFGVGERRCFLVFLATLLGEEVPKSFGADSAELEISNFSCFVISMLQTFKKTKC
jgi:hypothetical protein